MNSRSGCSLSAPARCWRSVSPPAAQRLATAPQQQRRRGASPAKSPAPARAPRRPPRKPGSPNSRTQTPTLTISYDPVGSGGGREQFIAGGVAYAGSDAALRRRRADRRGEATAAAPGELSRSRPTSRRSRSSTTSPASKTCSSTPRNPGEDLQPENHHLERPGDRQATTPTPSCPTPGSPRSTAPTSRAPRRTSPNTSPRCARAIWTYRSQRRLAGQGRRGRRRAPPASSKRSRRRRRDRLRRRQPGRRTRHRQDQSRRRLRRTDPEAAAKVLEIPEGDRGRGGDQYMFAFELDRKPTDAGHLPDRPRLLPDRLHRVRLRREAAS